MQNKFDKFGSFGAVLAAAACPICFPKLALLGAIFGMGALAQFESVFFFGAQILIILAIAGHLISYGQNRNRKLLSLAITSAALLFVSLYALTSETWAYIAFAGLILSSIWAIIESRRCSRCVNTTDS